MCRNIRPLFNFEPPASEAEVEAAALQFVRKISGFNQPSAANREAFEAAVMAITANAQTLLDALQTTSPAKDRETEKHKAQARNAQRFGT
ncbi:DUF2277 domain-containing protein [Herpetosiphon geysericola]|uniref:DUF2277 domain-containing protein n=1 Tax=Herpetosiphon geysericola TaxID=70996 RepID=A0A0P6XZN1_9CHLR|nr:DUF2277 domain-containing protein [Herpetosiphon geysericola]KPL90440.1 hypothetical protein SE18_07505 [Herpetosiphon geysericola]